MEEKNPLELTAVTVAKNSEQNKRGRPLSAKAVKFTPQPKSIISRLLRKVNEDNSDIVKNVSLVNVVNNNTHSRYNIENDSKYKTNSISEEPTLSKTYEGIQGNFTFDLTTLEDDHDSVKDNYILDDGEPNNFQSNTDTNWDKNECDTKLEIACYVCSHRSTSQKAHRKHLGTHRNQPYTCNFPNCKYTCKLSCNLIKHKRIHTSEKPYLCDQCTFRSNFANSLKVHKRIHTPERPYCCQYCSYRCNSSSNLKKHCLHKHRNV